MDLSRAQEDSMSLYNHIGVILFSMATFFSPLSFSPSLTSSAGDLIACTENTELVENEYSDHLF